MFEKINSETRKLLRDKTLKKLIITFLLIKIMIISIGITTQYMIPSEYTKRHLNIDNPILNPWTQYDAEAYLDIAKNGYNSNLNNGIGNYGWYPFYPLLIVIFSFVGYELAAFLISNFCSFLFVILLYFLVREDFDNNIAYRTILYTLLFPTAYFFTAMYSESLFMVLMLAMFLAARKEKWLTVGILGFFLSLTRMQGIFLSIPMFYLYMSGKSFSLKKLDKKILPLGLFFLGLATFLSYQYFITGDPFIQFHTQYYYRSISPPWESFANAVIRIISPPLTEVPIKEVLYNSFNLMIAIGFTVLCYLSYKLLRHEYTIYFIISIILPLISSTLEAISRFVLIIFPAFLVMAILSTKSKKANKIITFLYIISFILLIFFTIRHTNTMLLGIDWMK